MINNYLNKRRQEIIYSFSWQYPPIDSDSSIWSSTQHRLISSALFVYSFLSLWIWKSHNFLSTIHRVRQIKETTVLFFCTRCSTVNPTCGLIFCSSIKLHYTDWHFSGKVGSVLSAFGSKMRRESSNADSFWFFHIFYHLVYRGIFWKDLIMNLALLLSHLYCRLQSGIRFSGCTFILLIYYLLIRL